MTVGNAFAIHSVGKVNELFFSQKNDKQNKRKNNDVENKDTIISKKRREK